MGRSFRPLLLLWTRLSLGLAILHLPTPAQDDPKLQEALYRLVREAALFWQTAPGFLGRETIHQQVLLVHRRRNGTIDPKRQDESRSQEILSWYTLAAFRRAPEALREFRRIYEIDGKPLEEESEAKSALVAQIKSRDDHIREELLKQFENKSLAGTATDFGQLLLLFTKRNLDQYTFAQTTPSRVGADQALVIAFQQVGGDQALRIVDGRKKVAQKLQGEILVRQGDYLPLRITLNSTRELKDNEIRDEATLDYAVTQGALLPASLTYRRSVNGGVVVESTYRYSGWERAGK
ncbi:MAG: hypothetical protein M3Z32_09985 [Acidobacteriota bacterium]|nr:hypothetical protein [Acidobacteriota bacterium]